MLKTWRTWFSTVSGLLVLCSAYREQQSFWAWCQSSQSETCTHSRLVRGQPYSGTAFLSRSEHHRIYLAIPIALLTLNRNSTVGDAARKVMGDVPISYIEGVNGTRVSEDEIVAVGKHDVRLEPFSFVRFISIANVYPLGPLIQAWSINLCTWMKSHTNNQNKYPTLNQQVHNMRQIIGKTT